jgi:hypothetical protein
MIILPASTAPLGRTAERRLGVNPHRRGRRVSMRPGFLGGSGENDGGEGRWEIGDYGQEVSSACRG